MSLDPKYVLATPYQYYFVDKDTGLPLTEGIVTFYSDVNRSTLKPVFQLTGYPDYAYTELPNPLILSGVGTFDYLGNDIVPYLYPYDADGNIELYYVTVESVDNVEQFTREAWPNTFAQGAAEENNGITNYVPNGQFLLHHDIPADTLNDIAFGEITQPITDIAYGGWTFERPSISTANDNIQFFRYGSYVEPQPSASPRYEVQLTCNSPDAADSFKDIRLTFDDVNKFASDPEAPVNYTLSFSAYGVGTSFTVNLYTIRNYGTGGTPSATTVTFETSFVFPADVPTLFNYTITFPAQPLTQVGDNDDDYIQLAWTFPTAITSQSRITDVLLTPGVIDITAFPQTTTDEFLSASMVPPKPQPDGSNLYLPILLGPEGYVYDSSIVGKVFPTTYEEPAVGELLCDGSAYFYEGYSDDGIPYSRLGDKLLLSSGVFRFGSGVNFVNDVTWGSTGDSHFAIFTNKLGVQTDTADGANPTGFTFETTVTGQPDLGFNAYMSSTGSYLVAVNKVIGEVSGDNDSGNAPVAMEVNPNQGQNFGRPGTDFSAQVAVVAFGGVPDVEDYFNIATTTEQYYVWYTVDGVGADPAPGGTGIPVNILTGMVTIDVCRATVVALNAAQATHITTVAGSAIPNSAYFTFYANSQLYYAWYSNNNAGVDPNLFGGIGIEVPYTSASSANEVGENTFNAIGVIYFAVPDLRGMFIRGWDNGAGVDKDAAFRYSANPYNVGDEIGTLELDSIVGHLHDTGTSTTVQGGGVTPALQGGGNGHETAITGSGETAPVNMAFNYIIKY